MSRYLNRLEEEASTSERLTVADLELVRTELLQEINRRGGSSVKRAVSRKSPSGVRRFSYASSGLVSSVRLTNPKVVRTLAAGKEIQKYTCIQIYYFKGVRVTNPKVIRTPNKVEEIQQNAVSLNKL